MQASVLIVEDEVLQRDMLARLLKRKLGYESLQAEHGRQALDMLKSEEGKSIKIVILDLNMPVMDGLETLGILSQTYPALPVIMLTGTKDIEDAVQAMKLGATDFLTKPFEGERMLVTVKNALKISTLSTELKRIKSEQTGRFTFSGLIGHDGGLAKTIAVARKAASSDIPVLMTGETGVGKEVFSKAIHGESVRAGKPFIAVNCGAIPQQLVESTLFGHEKGSFTGATDKVIGKFREADGGSIFLDEVGELPLDAQVKLLRVLQQKEVEPVGAGKPVPVNVRILSATNRDLEEEVKAGRFREDLYFRLNVLQIELPPLRERRQDIRLLARHFIDRNCAAEGRTPKDIDVEAFAVLEQYEWPGNVRQLENAINRAMVLSEGESLGLADFQSLLEGEGESGHLPVFPTSGGLSGPALSLVVSGGEFKTIEEIEREAMQAALAHFDGNTTQAAKALGMAKSTFYRKMGD